MYNAGDDEAQQQTQFQRLVPTGSQMLVHMQHRASGKADTPLFTGVSLERLTDHCDQLTRNPSTPDSTVVHRAPSTVHHHAMPANDV